MQKHVMNRLLILSVFLSTQQLLAIAAKCSTDPCTNIGGGEWMAFDDEKSCKKLEHCCWSGKECRALKFSEFKTEGSASKEKTPSMKFKDNPFNPPNKDKARLLPIGPPIFPHCPPPMPFPEMCHPRRNEPFVIEPPMNIPYCLRIPCSKDRHSQSKYDRDLRSCGEQPGCYFDRELYEYRDAFGPSVLPGVPVCQLAIRTKILPREAENVIYMYGFWNPYFTNCFLNTFHDEIMEGPPGCKLIPLLEAFHVKPKLAGWRGILPKECGYIGACWMKGECLYPLNPKSLTIEVQQKYDFNKYEIPFGRPKCQHFNPSNPYTAVKSYHSCLSAGCSVDSSITMKYYHYMFAIGNTMSAKDHWLYWDLVLSGVLGPHNIDSVQWKYNKDVKFGARPPPPPKISKPVDNAFPFPVPNRGGAKSLSMPPLPRRGKSEACGHIFRPWNFRPCPPDKLPPMHYNKYCPYKPLNLPRFPRLKGSFDGCCDINECYISRSDIRNAYSGPATYVTKWSSWSHCSVSCGGKGYRYKYRRHVGPLVKHNKIVEKDTESCYNECAGWGRWSEWSRCPNRDCARQERSRECLPEGSICKGASEETRLCNASWWC
ncbi:uncharacterized protein LOC120329040 [Styela clava]